jgi:hypothetical protein
MIHLLFCRLHAAITGKFPNASAYISGMQYPYKIKRIPENPGMRFIITGYECARLFSRSIVKTARQCCVKCFPSAFATAGPYLNSRDWKGASAVETKPA